MSREETGQDTIAKHGGNGMSTIYTLTTSSASRGLSLKIGHIVFRFL